MPPGFQVFPVQTVPQETAPVVQYRPVWLIHAYVPTYTPQISYLVLVDLVEMASLFGQARGWPLPALPIVIAGDGIGALMLVCSRDWHGYWYWHGPYYSLRQQIGMGLLIALP